MQKDIQSYNISFKSMKRVLSIIDIGVDELCSTNKPEETDIGILKFYALELPID